MQLNRLSKTDLKNFELVFDLTKEDSFWKGGKFKFTVTVDNDYPHKPPKVHCDTPVYHPNIDTEGNVCLNILRGDWQPVLGVTPIVLGLLFLFIDPNPNDPLNQNAAKVQRDNINQFKENIRRSLQGYSIDGIQYPRMI